MGDVTKTTYEAVMSMKGDFDLSTVTFYRVDSVAYRHETVTARVARPLMEPSRIRPCNNHLLWKMIGLYGALGILVTTHLLYVVRHENMIRYGTSSSSSPVDSDVTVSENEEEVRVLARSRGLLRARLTQRAQSDKGGGGGRGGGVGKG